MVVIVLLFCVNTILLFIVVFSVYIPTNSEGKFPSCSLVMSSQFDKGVIQKWGNRRYKLVGYMDVLYRLVNIANICNNCKQRVNFKIIQKLKEKSNEVTSYLYSNIWQLLLCTFKSFFSFLFYILFYF